MARTKSKPRFTSEHARPRQRRAHRRTDRRRLSARERRLRLGQNFFKSRQLVRQVVRSSCISARDRVLEIGAGSGMITRELAAVARHVTAIERDPQWAEQLQRSFQAAGRVQVIESDFLRTALPREEYKVFASIPFNETANIVRKLLHGAHPPSAAYLVMQAEAAQKFAGTPRETEFSVQLKPWFELRIVRSFRRSDFVPAPAVNVVLLHVQKRDPPWLAPSERAGYRRFVRRGFRGRRTCLRLTYKGTFGYGQWKRLARELAFDRDAIPSELTAAQWVGLYRFLREQRTK